MYLISRLNQHKKALRLDYSQLKDCDDELRMCSSIRTDQKQNH